MAKVKAIRVDETGVDDVAISCSMFRLERMADNEWWACAYVGKGKKTKAVMFALSWNKKAKRIDCVCYEDEVGCVDDTKPTAKAQA